MILVFIVGIYLFLVFQKMIVSKVIIQYEKSPPIFQQKSILWFKKTVFKLFKKEPIDWDLDDLDQLDVKEGFKIVLDYTQEHENQASKMPPEHCILN